MSLLFLRFVATLLFTAAHICFATQMPTCLHELLDMVAMSTPATPGAILRPYTGTQSAGFLASVVAYLFGDVVLASTCASRGPTCISPHTSAC